MNKAELKALLTEANVEFNASATLSTLQGLAVANGLIQEEQESDDDDNAPIKRRPAPSPAYKTGDVVNIKGLDIADVQFHYNKPYLTERARKKYETSEGANDGSFNAYSFRRNGVTYPFVSPNAKFDSLFNSEDISSFKLVAEVTGETTPATDWDEARPTVNWLVEKVVSTKMQSNHNRANFEEFIFNPATFQANPSLLAKSGMLERVLDGSA